MVTLLLTVFRDLTEAILVAVALGALLFIHRMAQVTAVEAHVPAAADDRADTTNGDRKPYDETAAADPQIVVYRISGAFFFGAVASVETVLDRIADTHRVLIVDFAAVPFLDSTAAHTIEGLARKATRHGVRVLLSGTAPTVRRDLVANGVAPPLVTYEATVEDALSVAREAGLHGA